MLTRESVWMRCACVLLLSNAIRGLQRFSELPAYTEVNPGQDALLRCRVADMRGQCSWQKDNKPAGIFKGKYEWANEDSPTGGDCSLWVRSATQPLDDGQWQCQVTASNYNIKDALSSPPVALAVRVEPHLPQIIYNGSHVSPGENITLQDGTRASVVCEARYGNPPASIQWFLGTELLHAWGQTNTSEVEQPRVWAARSVLELAASRASHGRQLECRASHPSYPPPHYRRAYTQLDVTFPPVVSISGADDGALSKLEEGTGVVALECRAEGNPSPRLWWTRDGHFLSTAGPKLILAPLTRNHSGIYGCHARNSLGTSDSPRIEIDVKYPPRVLWVGPEAALKANLFSQVVLECKAEGNPEPLYQWIHNPSPRAGGRGDDGYVVSRSWQLTLHNVTYKDHGQYQCVAVNNIGFEKRSHKSETMTLSVLGPPLGVEAGAAQAWSGGEAAVAVDVCADPPPRAAAWYWGSQRLQVPTQVGRYNALEPTRAADCYRYTLLISDAASQDARVYVLHVENERGSTKHAVSLTLHQSSHVVPLAAASLVIASLLLIIVCLLRKCRRSRDTVQYKTEDLDNEKGSALPADAVYTSRDTMRRTPAPASPAVWGGGGAATAAAGGRYSPAALQAALASLEREAKDNIYAVLDPHIQYDVTISKHGSLPTHLSLTRPLHRDDTILNSEQQFTTFQNQEFVQETDADIRAEQLQRAKGNSKDRRNIQNIHNRRTEHVSKSNRDVKYKSGYKLDAPSGVSGDNEKKVVSDRKMTINSNNFRGSQRREQNGGYIRRYDRQGSNRSGKLETRDQFQRNKQESNNKRVSNRSVKYDRNGNVSSKQSYNKFDDSVSRNGGDLQNGGNGRVRYDDQVPRPNSGMVRALASRFNTNGFDDSRNSNSRPKTRPKSLQTFDNPQYLDHVFPAAVEI